MDTKRFNTPEYKRQIKAVRNYRRQVPQKPETPAGKFFYTLGLDSDLRKFFLFLVFVLLVYLVYFAKFLQINAYDISGVDSAAQQNVISYLNQYESGFKYLMPQKNIIFFNAKDFSNYLLSKDSQIAKVNSLRKSFWHKLIINLDQRFPAFTLEAGGRVFILNSDGTVDQEITAQYSLQDPAPYPVIVDTLPDNVALSDDFFTDQQSSFIEFMANNFEKQISATIKSYELPGKASNQLVVYTDKGFKVLFSDITDPRDYLQRLTTLWQQLTPAQQSSIAYFDLRFQKNAYSCFKTDPCAH